MKPNDQLENYWPSATLNQRAVGLLAKAMLLEPGRSALGLTLQDSHA